MVVNNTHKQAAKAALGLLVASRGVYFDWAAAGVSKAAFSMGLQLGDLDSVMALSRYAHGVETNGERVSNRRWVDYSAAVRKLAYQLANQAEAEIDALLA